MQRIRAAGSRPKLAAAALGLIFLLVLGHTLAAGSPAGAAPAPTGPPRFTRDATSCQGIAQLKISTLRPVQLRAVAFDAAASRLADGAVVFYDFSYGDGTDDASTQPTAVHAYPQTGTYAARVNIVTTCNTVVSSAAYRIRVRDGLPPTVRISYPKSGQTVHFGSRGLQLRGTADDPSGVGHVEIAIQILSVLRAARPQVAGCYWYDGHVSLRLRACGSPLFFPAKLTGTHWTFRMNARSQIPPGEYGVRVRATDRAGNRTAVFSTKLGDIQGFRLVP